MESIFQLGDTFSHACSGPNSYKDRATQRLSRGRKQIPPARTNTNMWLLQKKIRIIHLAGNVNQKYQTVETQRNINSLTISQCRINLHRTKRQEHRQQQRHALQGSEESQSIVIHSNMFRLLKWGVKHSWWKSANVQTETCALRQWFQTWVLGDP